MKIASAEQHRQQRERLAVLVENAILSPAPLVVTSSKPYRNKSYSIIGWTGPKVKGVLVRRKFHHA